MTGRHSSQTSILLSRKKTAALEGQQREKKDLKVVCVLPDLMDRGVAAFRRPNINLV